MTSPPLRFDPIDEAVRHWDTSGWTDASPAMAVVTSVMRVQQIFLARVEQRLRPFDLSFARYEVLMLLLFSREGRLPLGKMGERLQVHSSSVTNAIDRLEQQGFVRRLPNPADGRGRLAEITASGREVAEQSTATLNAEVFDDIGLTEPESEGLVSVLRTIRRGAGDFA